MSTCMDQRKCSQLGKIMGVVLCHKMCSWIRSGWLEHTCLAMTLVLLQIVLISFSDIYGCEDVDTHNGIVCCRRKPQQDKDNIKPTKKRRIESAHIVVGGSCSWCR